MDLGLEGKTVIVTGGSGGIGWGLVLEFARQGCNVISASRDVEHGRKLEQEARSQGLSGQVLAVKTDITDRASVDAMVSIAHQRFGPVDVLVNNAGGVAHLWPRFEDYDEEARRWEVDLNINGVTNCIQAVASDMLNRGKGSIINIGSGSSTSGRGAANVVHYGALKGFMNSLTIGLAWEWAPRGVRVNNILPGWIVPYQEEHVGKGSFWNRFGFQQIGRPEDMRRALEEGTLFNVDTVPMGRLGRPEDIARLALFLASDVSSYITGQNISVSGSGP